MLIDEFYFHERRGLPLWERVGHPLDTLTVLSCFYLTLYFPYTDWNLYLFLGLAALSCLFITKDEWIHSKECSGSENWLHSLQYILHPLVLAGAVSSWRDNHRDILFWQTVIVQCVFTYQIFRWNILWKARR